MKTRQIHLSVGHRKMRAHWLLPTTMNPWQAGVIVLHDIMGFTDDIVSIAQRMCRLGYAVIAPDLYDQPGLKPLCVVKTLKAHNTGKGYAFEQLEACRQWLLSQDEEKVAQVGMMGFCMGGRFTVLYGARAPLTVVAPFYGEIPKERAQLEGICPTVGGWGQRDLLFGSHGQRLSSHLTCLGVRHDIVTYEKAGHSYMNNHQGVFFRQFGDYTPLRARYDEAAAEDSWARVTTFFADEFARHRG